MNAYDSGTVVPAAHGPGVVHCMCQGSTPATCTLAGGIDPVVTVTPGVMPCG